MPTLAKVVLRRFLQPQMYTQQCKYCMQKWKASTSQRWLRGAGPSSCSFSASMSSSGVLPHMQRSRSASSPSACQRLAPSAIRPCRVETIYK